MENKDVLYAKWLSGEISDAELQSLEGAEALSDMKKVIRSMDTWSMPSYETSQGYEKFKQKHQTPTPKVRRLNWFALSGIAASFLVLVFVGSKYVLNQNQSLTADYGKQENLALSDGSEIWLNDGSTIEFNTRSWDTQRTIQLSGEALFEVSKGSPFTVNTQLGSVKVLGTQFNVRAWGTNLYVECYEGRVQVKANNQEVILTAGERINVIQGSMSAKQVITSTEPAWQQGMSRFYNEKLQEVFSELERQYAISVNAKSIDRSFSGNFRHDDLDTALNSICKPMNLDYTISDDQKSVLIE